jgi:hypothetical protein
MIDIIDDAPCDPSESKSVFSSASPLGITAFRQNVVGKDKIQFSFDIVHAGSGDVFTINPSLDNARIFIRRGLAELDRGTPNVEAAKKAIEDTTAEKDDAIERLNAAKNGNNDDAIDVIIVHLRTALEESDAEGIEDVIIENDVIGLLDELIVDCPKDASVRRSKEDKVRVTVNTGIEDDDTSAAPNIELICVGLGKNKGGIVSGLANLVNGKRTVTCTQTFSTTRPDFIQPMDITLDFNYLDSIDKNILVKHLG